jgi:hypothetical protein
MLQHPPGSTPRKYVPDGGSMLRGIWSQSDDLDRVDIWLGFKVSWESQVKPGVQESSGEKQST